MRQFRGQPPSRELEFGALCICLHEFDRGFLRLPVAVLRKKYGAVFTAAHVLAQLEFPVDDLAFPPFPGLGHFAPPLAPPFVRSYKSTLLYPSTRAGAHPGIKSVFS